MDQYVGTIVQVRFYNDQSRFIVAVIDDDDLEKPLLITGLMNEPKENQRYRFYGEFVVHPKYGKQFKFSHYEEVLANDYEEIIRYLSSPLFKGIGKIQATYIVDALGENALEMIKEDSDVLNNIKGMTLSKKQTICEILNTQSYDSEVMQFLMSHGISMAMIDKVLVTYKEEAMKIINEYPYQLIEDIEGIQFKSVDQLALSIGVERQDERRIKALVYHLIKDLCYQSGNTYIDEGSLLNRLQKFDYTIELEAFQQAISEMIEENKLYRHGEKLLVDLYEEAEKSIADHLLTFMGMEAHGFEQTKIDEQIHAIEERDHIVFDESQREAMALFLESPLMILTGGPGTGKTTIVKAAIDVFSRMNRDCPISLVAPTGRAAKRLSELTGLESQTIHRLLKWDIQKNEFMHDAQHPLETSLLIIDEFSMVDTVLFARLLEACSKVEKILIIGDHEQLPSVSPGNVLRDLLLIESIPTIRLNKIYRQKESSGIVKMAHEIRNDEMQSFDLFDDYKDIHFMDCANTQVLGFTKKIVEKALSEGYSNSEIQVLAPMYQGIAGIDALNEMLQDVMNPKSEFHQEIRVGQRVFREGDKILQLKNRVDDNVFNGDIGTLVEIRLKDNVETLSDTIVVDFDGIFVEYPANDFNSITLAYCMSIHKAQGSEFKIVILPILNDYYVMLQKKLLYTGITRAKQSLFLLGQRQAFVRGITTQKTKERCTYLKERFNEEKGMSLYDFMD